MQEITNAVLTSLCVGVRVRVCVCVCVCVSPNAVWVMIMFTSVYGDGVKL